MTHRVAHSFAALLATLSALTLLAVGTGTGMTTPAAAAEDFGLELDHGHVDAFTLLWDGSGLDVGLQEDVTGHHVLHQPEDVLLAVKEQARTQVPENLAFLGDVGSDVWLLPQTQDQELVWPGWSTEQIPPATFTGPMRIDVESVDGPGKVYLWQTGTFGGASSVLASGGYQLPGRVAPPVGAHVHANWAFTQPGRYTLDVRAGGTLTTGATVESDPVTYTFDVRGAGSTPTPDPTPDPTPAPEPTPTPEPTPAPTPTPQPGVWDVPNGTINSHGAAVLNDGHVDIASLLEGKNLVTRVKDTTTPTLSWREPEKTVLQLLPGTRTTVPANSAYSFLGAPGAPFYQVTQTQQPALLWPGWSTEAIPADATTGGVLWTLDGVAGPGHFAIYETDPFGRPAVLFNTRDGITAADRFTIPKNTHAHGSWAFSEQGLYCISGQRVAQLASGETASDQFEMAVAVGTADVMGVDPSACGAAVSTETPVVPPPAAEDGSGGKKGGKKGDKGDKKGDKGDAGADDAASGSTPTGPGAEACVAPQPASGRAPLPTSRRLAPTVLSAGHIDYAARIVGGRLVSQIGDDTSGSKVYREPSSVVMWLKPESKVTLPDGYGQVGSRGSTVWQVPQTQNRALIWLGWNTETLNAGNARGTVAWRLDRVEGPGTVKVYLSGSFGGVQEMVFSGAGSSYSIPLGVHTHANWAFSREGVYRLSTTQTVTLADGTRSSDTETMTIAVGDVDPTSLGTSETTGTTTTSAPTGDTTSTADGCGSGSVASTVSSSTADLVVAAAPQAVAPAATTGLSLQPSPDVTERASDASPVASPAATSGDPEPVPMLLGALGGLLLVGAGGTGALWWRRPAAAEPTA